MAIKFPLRYKLLILLVSLPTIMLGLYLLLATNLFKQDKLAYIFDSEIIVTRSIAGQLRSEMQFLKSITNSLMREYDIEEKRFSTIGTAIFNEESTLKAILVIHSQLNRQTSKLLQKNDMDLSIQKAFSHNKLKSLEDQMKSHHFAIDYFDIEKSLFYVAFPTTPTIWSVSIYESLGLMPIFNNKTENGYFLVDSSGTVLLGDTLHTTKSYAQDVFFSEIKKLNLPEGTIDSNFKNKEILVSYARVGLKDVIILSKIDKDSAFGALGELTRKSILFFLSLISAAIIVSLLASKHLTKRLTKLGLGVEQITLGNFDYRIESQSKDKDRSTDELSLLTVGFNSMGEKITQLLGDLKQYSENLEKMVEDRTRELHKANNLITAMMNGLGQGIFVFDSNGAIAPFYTKSCHYIFQTDLMNKSMQEILLQNVNDPNELKTLEKWRIALFAQLLPFKDMALLGPKFSTKNPDLYVEINYIPILDTIDGIEQLIGCMVVATDKTAQKIIQEKSKSTQEYSEMILKIVKNKLGFLTFYNEAKNMLDQLDQMLKREDLFQASQITLLLHSLKGGAGIYSLGVLRQKIHDHETNFGKLQQYHEQVNYLINALEDIQNEFTKIVEDFSLILGPSMLDGLERVEILRNDLLDFNQILKKYNVEVHLQNMYNERFLHVPIENYLRSFNEIVLDLAKKNNKKTHGIVFKNGDLKINPDHFRPLFGVLVHPFVNAIDHGLEDASTRTKNKKSEFGTIIVQTTKENINNKDYIKIMIQDDGAGIDPEKIRNKMRTLSYSEDEINQNDHQVIQHIFDHAFSTSTTISLSSGRGVGMDALKTVVKQMGGIVDVTSRPTVGTSLRIFIPSLS